MCACEGACEGARSARCPSPPGSSAESSEHQLQQGTACSLLPVGTTRPLQHWSHVRPAACTVRRARSQKQTSTFNAGHQEFQPAEFTSKQTSPSGCFSHACTSRCTVGPSPGGLLPPRCQSGCTVPTAPPDTRQLPLMDPHYRPRTAAGGPCARRFGHMLVTLNPSALFNCCCE